MSQDPRVGFVLGLGLAISAALFGFPCFAQQGAAPGFGGAPAGPTPPGVNPGINPGVPGSPGLPNQSVIPGRPGYVPGAGPIPGIGQGSQPGGSFGVPPSAIGPGTQGMGSRRGPGSDLGVQSGSEIVPGISGSLPTPDSPESRPSFSEPGLSGPRIQPLTPGFGPTAPGSSSTPGSGDRGASRGSGMDAGR